MRWFQIFLGPFFTPDPSGRNRIHCDFSIFFQLETSNQLHSLKLAAIVIAPAAFCPNSEAGSSSNHPGFQVLLLLVSGRVDLTHFFSRTVPRVGGLVGFFFGVINFQKIWGRKDVTRGKHSGRHGMSPILLSFHFTYVRKGSMKVVQG